MDPLFDLTAVIPAGGRGGRLRPYTAILPKPLLPIGDKPVLYYLMRRLYQCGVRNFYVSIHYLGEFFQTYFKDSSMIGPDAKLHFVREETLSGTIGPLRIIPNLPTDFLVVNGDRLTDFDFRELIRVRRETNALVTIAAGNESIALPYGTFKLANNGEVQNFSEKPQMNFVVSRGAYAMHNSVLELIPGDRPYGFDQLMYDGLARSKLIICHVNQNTWLDIGKVEDLQRAQRLFEEGSDIFEE